MSIYEVNKLILETQLIQLKKDADWWVISGIAIIILSSFSFGFLFFYSVFPILIFFAGILVLLKGTFLMKTWIRLNGEYLDIKRADMDANENWVPKY